MKVIDNLKSSVTIDDGVLLKASGFNYELRDSQIHIPKCRRKRNNGSQMIHVYLSNESESQ